MRMSELEAEFHYNGHVIAITCVERGRAWHWSYVMDGTSRFEMQGPGLPTDDVAIEEARRDAQKRIDRLP
jgi:hypothetical protein